MSADVSADLDARKRLLDENFNRLKSKPVVSVRLDHLRRVIDEIDGDPKLQSLFGKSPSAHMALVYDTGAEDFLIADEKMADMSGVDEHSFVRKVSEILDRIK